MHYTLDHFGVEQLGKEMKEALPAYSGNPFNRRERSLPAA